MILYQLAVTAVLFGMAAVLAVNIPFFRRLPPRRSGTRRPFISILIPARNEEGRIGACVASLVAQDYRECEIIVCDDASEDATLRVATEAAAGDSRVRFIRSEALPPGWTGKNHACHQLAQHARGEVLLFTDADTVWESGGIERAASAREIFRVDLLSLVPMQRMESFWEKTFMPLLHFVTLCFLPLPLATWTRNTALAMANGQCMLFTRAMYDRCGGHAGVRDAIVDDVWLARAVKQHGGRIRVMDGGGTLSCRMYDSLQDIWNGFSKNIFPGLGRSLFLLLVVLAVNLATSIAPLGFALAALIMPGAEGWSYFVFAQLALLLGIRFALAVKLRMSLVHIVLHPAAIFLLLLISINSARLSLSRRGAEWKGRTYARHVG